MTLPILLSNSPPHIDIIVGSRSREWKIYRDILGFTSMKSIIVGGLERGEYIETY